MKNTLLSIGLAGLLFMSIQSQAQTGLNRAEKEYERLAYVDAIDLYKKIYKRGHSSSELLQNLGNSYYFNANYAEAHTYYSKLFNDYPDSDIEAVYYYRYAHTLQNVGAASEAKQYYDLYTRAAGSGSLISQNRKEESSLQQQIKANSGRYSNIENLPINSPYADYGSFVKDETLYFASSRDTGSLAKKVHTWTGNAFTTLYQATEEGSDAKSVKRIKGNVKSRLNESGAVITKDGSTMYFTRNNVVGGKRRYDAEKTTKLKLFKATWDNGKWTGVEELPFNSDNYNTAHPALSADERTLYFSSDRPGGYGSSDLWKVSVNKDTYGKPENLGPGINTEERESFPYVSADGTLYFASNGRVGLGGLDVFAVKIKDDNTFGKVQNVGAPVNTQYDDFAYYIDSNKRTGFFTSNRAGGKGDDDIYSFREDRPLTDCEQDLIIQVVDADTGALITDAEVILFDHAFAELSKSKAYQSDRYPFDIDYDCGDRFQVRASREGYITREIAVSLPNQSGVTKKVIELEPAKIAIKEGDDLFKVLKLNPIYFDLDKYNIRPDAALELAKVFAVLEEYPTMKIDIRSHTDSRASHRYNETLSSNRAESTGEWLIENGINRNRLTWKGYGETQLTNGCADGVQCSEAEHQANRRSEFIVVQM